MSGVQRYKVKGAWTNNPFVTFVEEEMVLSSDFDALAAKLAAVELNSHAEMERRVKAEAKWYTRTEKLEKIADITMNSACALCQRIRQIIDAKN
jgi:hypothetical protein